MDFTVDPAIDTKGTLSISGTPKYDPDKNSTRLESGVCVQRDDIPFTMPKNSRFKLTHEFALGEPSNDPYGIICMVGEKDHKSSCIALVTDNEPVFGGSLDKGAIYYFSMPDGNNRFICGYRTYFTRIEVEYTTKLVIKLDGEIVVDAECEIPEVNVEIIRVGDITSYNSQQWARRTTFGWYP